MSHQARTERYLKGAIQPYFPEASVDVTFIEPEVIEINIRDTPQSDPDYTMTMRIGSDDDWYAFTDGTFLITVPLQPEPVELDPRECLYRSTRYTDADRQVMHTQAMEEWDRDRIAEDARELLESYTKPQDADEPILLEVEYLLDMDLLQSYHMAMNPPDTFTGIDYTSNHGIEVERLVRLGYLETCEGGAEAYQPTAKGLRALEEYY